MDNSGYFIAMYYHNIISFLISTIHNHVIIHLVVDWSLSGVYPGFKEGECLYILWA